MSSGATTSITCIVGIDIHVNNKITGSYVLPKTGAFNLDFESKIIPNVNNFQELILKRRQERRGSISNNNIGLFEDRISVFYCLRFKRWPVSDRHLALTIPDVPCRIMHVKARACFYFSSL